jgi:hypothetical protein
VEIIMFHFGNMRWKGIGYKSVPFRIVSAVVAVVLVVLSRYYGVIQLVQ